MKHLLFLFKDCNLIPFKRGDIVDVPIKRRWEQMNMDSEVSFDCSFISENNFPFIKNN